MENPQAPMATIFLRPSLLPKNRAPTAPNKQPTSYCGGGREISVSANKSGQETPKSNVRLRCMWLAGAKHGIDLEQRDLLLGSFE